MPSYTKDRNDTAAAIEREQYLEKPLPNSADSERVILGAIILDNTKISQAIEQLRPDDFYVPAHRRIFLAMIALFERGSTINELLVAEELKKEGTIESVGGITAISNLTYGLPHFAELDPFSKIVRDRALQRNLIKVCNKTISEVLEGEEDADIMLDHAEQAIFALADERTRQGFAHIRPVAEKLLEQVEEMSGRRVMLTGLTTGFSDFDQLTSGLQPSDLIIVAARPSMGKCLEANSEIILSDGSVETIEEIYQKRNATLLTLQNNLKFKATVPDDYVDDGVKPVYCVKTRLGRKIECTLSHPFLAFEDWTPLYDLQVGQKIAVPRVMNVFGNEEMRECEVKLLGYLIGDGSITQATLRFIVGKPMLRQDFEKAVSEFGGVEAVQSRQIRQTFELRIRKPKDSKERTNPLTDWLRQLNLFGCNSHTKFIPPQIFRLKKNLVALFLNRLFATDGWASVLASGQVQLGYSSVSEKLAQQVQHLLLRFGIIASLKERRIKYKDERRISWQLDITDARSIKTFIEEIGIYGKEEALKACANAIESRNYQTNKDLIPVEVWSHIARLKGRESWMSLAQRTGLKGYTNIHVGKRAPTRDRLLALSLALKSAALEYIATSEIYWDEIVSIEYAGEKQVYDLTVPETHNFVANDICVHNTSLCLTLAQNAAIQASAVVAVFSLEMSKESLVMRMLCSEGRVDAHRFRSGFLARDEWPRLASALATLSEAKIYIDDTPGITVLEMRAKARRLATEQKRLDLIIVDYLQLMSGSGRAESRQQEVSKISRELKGLAKELNVPLIALSQLSRAPETRTDHRPQLADLRESGSLEQDADVVAFIYREEQYNRTEENAGLAEIIIAKQRNGPTGTVKLAFLKEFTRFENMWRE
jgi:replicative DNA helicase